MNIYLLTQFCLEEAAAICAPPNTLHTTCGAVHLMVPSMADAQRCCSQFAKFVGFFLAFSLASLETQSQTPDARQGFRNVSV